VPSFFRSLLGKCEAEQKRTRGQSQEKLLQQFLKGCDSGIGYCQPYLHLGDDYPDNRAITEVAEDIVERISALQEQFRHIGLRQEQNGTFDGKRLGTSWNGSWGSLLKAYISSLTGWDNEKVLTAIVHLVRAMQQTAHPKPCPDLRRLLQKTIRRFEANPRNAEIRRRLAKG
jgi:hypothetical protein